MINLKEMLTENRDLSARRGCLMAMISKEDTAKILQFSKQLIKDEDLYLEGNEYGRETESHVTIRYGFLKDLNELDVRQLIQGQKPFMMELMGLNKFTTPPKYDVAMFKVSSPVLKRLNELSGVHLNESEYPDYTPHLTLAYVQKGKFPHIKEGLSLKVPVRTICYSPISGDKSYFDLNENNTHYDVESEIARLEQEWDRLDSTGTGLVRQQEIQQELQKLRNKAKKQHSQEPKAIEPNYEKTKDLWTKLRTSI